ncbi:MAG TPA: transporter substrate-binding domain-containing protein [Hyphomicrobiaceae bacterium]|nr:transporter substrate-binding domain-containing protein [Hyphomicrobiaceae bacterium]
MAVLCLSLPAQAGETLNKIKKTGKVVVGTEAAFPPFEFVKGGKIVGYGKDILNHVVAGLDAKLEQRDVPWQGILPGLLAKKFDFVATSVILNPNRAKKFAFTMPIADGSLTLVKRKGDMRIKSVADLSGKSVATQLGTSAEKDLRAVNNDLKKKGKAGVKEMRLFTSIPEAYFALANRQVDAVLSPLPSVIVVIKKRPGVYEIVGPIGKQKSYFAWVTRKEDTELRDYINRKIKELHVSGMLTKLQEKWFGFRMELPTSGYLPEGAI